MIVLSKILRAVNYLLILFLVGFMVFMLITEATTLPIAKLLTVFCIIPLIMVPYFIDKIFSYQMGNFINFFYYLFLILALVFGSILNFYDKIWWFDLFTHFVSGVLCSIVAFILLKENNIIKKNNKLFCFIFILMFTIGIAAGWEYFEFFCDKIFDGDAQWVIETGVNDTMTDMLIASLGGIISGFYYLFYVKRKKVN